MDVVKRVAAALAGLAAVLVTASAAADIKPPIKPMPPARSADDLTVKLSSHQAGAKGVTLTLTYSAMLQCGRPRGTASVHLPASVGLPAKIAASDVRMNGRLVASAVIRKHVLSVSAPRLTGMTCDSITSGKVILIVSADARLSNPAKAGTYTASVVSAGSVHSGKYTVS
jgi:hypothetical protein